MRLTDDLISAIESIISDDGDVFLFAKHALCLPEQAFLKCFKEEPENIYLRLLEMKLKKVDLKSHELYTKFEKAKYLVDMRKLLPLRGEGTTI